jgi:glycosyltransferase involved in cell wall biosynthesis
MGEQMKTCIIGKALTNNRTGKFVNALIFINQCEIIWDATNESSSSRISKWVKIVIEIINIFRSDVVYFGPFSHSKTRLMRFAKLMGKLVIVDFYASYYDMLVNDTKTVEKSSEEAKELIRVDQTAIEMADRLIFLNKAERSYYLSCIMDSPENVITNKIDILPLVIDNKECAQLNYFRGKDQKLRIIWWGTYIPLHGLDVIIDAMKLLSDWNMNFELLIWGNDTKKAEPYIAKVHSLKLNEKIRFINEWRGNEYYGDYVPKNCDIMLGIFGSSLKAKTVIANKVIDGVAFQMPMITAESEGLKEFFDGKNDIWMINNTSEDLAQTLLDVSKASHEMIRSRTDRAYQIYCENFSQKAFNLKVKNLFDKIQ